jgi:hypothetical protein
VANVPIRRSKKIIPSDCIGGIYLKSKFSSSSSFDQHCPYRATRNTNCNPTFGKSPIVREIFIEFFLKSKIFFVASNLGVIFFLFFPRKKFKNPIFFTNQRHFPLTDKMPPQEPHLEVFFPPSNSNSNIARKNQPMENL